MDSEKRKSRSMKFQKPGLDDANQIYNLVKRSQPLDINSLYSYLLVCAHFNRTSIVTKYDNQVVGYVSAYIKPQRDDTLFIWQVAVAPSMRGQGLASKMIHQILQRRELQEIKYIETTVTPSNQASMNLFKKISQDLNCDIKKSSYFTRDLFGESSHEEELLLCIGPLKK
jgi:L-2,4-diaminobutyric acid acetyltransferase